MVIATAVSLAAHSSMGASSKSSAERRRPSQTTTKIGSPQAPRHRIQIENGIEIETCAYDFDLDPDLGFAYLLVAQ
jgi:hypothetical protein